MALAHKPLVALLAFFVLALSLVEASAETPAPPLLRQEQVEPVLERAQQLLGVEYRFGAAPSRQDAVDCSSLVLKAFQAVGHSLPRTAYGQSKRGMKISVDALRRGDRLYFKMTGRDVPVDHTALYLGEGRMLHAFPVKGVTIEPLADYRDYLVGARR